MGKENLYAEQQHSLKTQKLNTIENGHHTAGWWMWSPHCWVINVITSRLGDKCGRHMAGRSMWSPHAWVTVLHAQGKPIPHGWVINVITSWLGDKCGCHMAGRSMWSPHAWVSPTCARQTNTTWLGDQCDHLMAGWWMWSPHGWDINVVTTCLGHCPTCARLCTCPKISLESNYAQVTLQKSFGWDYLSLMCIPMQNNHTHTHTQLSHSLYIYIYNMDVKNTSVQQITETQKITQHALNIDVSKASKLDTYIYIYIYIYISGRGGRWRNWMVLGNDTLIYI